MSSLISWFSSVKTRDSRPKRQRTRRLRFESLEQRQMLTTFFVDGDIGDDIIGDGSDENPFATIQRGITEADDSVTPGADTIKVKAGTYVENLMIEDDDALTIEGSGDVTIDGNASGNVIDSTSTDLTLKKLTITNGDDGVFAEGGSLFVEKVEVVENSGDGLVGDGLSIAVIEESRFADNGQRGLELQNLSALELKKVTAENNDDAGARVKDFDSVLVEDSDFSNNLEDGLLLLLRDNPAALGNVIVKKVTANGNLKQGLDFDNQLGGKVGSIDIEDSTFNKNVLAGIEIDDVTEVTIEKVEAESNEQHGLDIRTATSVTIEKGSYSKNGAVVSGDGIIIADVGNLKLKDVTAKENSRNGLAINGVDSATNVTIEKGKYSKNGADGISIVDVATALLENVKAEENFLNGLAIDGDSRATTVTIEKGKYSKNGADGINIVDAGNIELEKVKGEKNGDDGLDVSNSGKVTLKKVKFKKNGDQNIIITP